MKKYSVFLLVSAFFFLSLCGKDRMLFAQYAAQNISLLSHWDNASTIAEPIYNIRYNSVWGWVDPQDNKEYAIIGSTDGTYFIDVSVPTAPVVRDYVKGRRDSCIWREYKNYQQYLYAVSDDQVNSFNQNSLQIINMSYLPDSVHVEYDKDTLITRAHTVFIDGNKMYCGSVFMPNYGGHSNMGVYSIANPVAPTLLRMLEQDYPSNGNVHDMFVRNDTCYASSGNSGLFIYKLNSNNSLSMIGSLTSYTNQGYNHSSALTANGKTLIFTDEVPVNLPVKSLDVSNFGNLTVLQNFKSTPGSTATPHNVFIPEGSNSRVVVAYYQDGIQVFDISNPSNVTRTGFFDMATSNCPSCPNPNYSGCWGAYIDLPSGIVLASDMQDGLFVLNASQAMGIPIVTHELSTAVFPNPFATDFQLNFSLLSGETVSYELTDVTGNCVLKKEMHLAAGKTSVMVDASSLSTGTYLLQVQAEDISVTKKLIKTN